MEKCLVRVVVKPVPAYGLSCGQGTVIQEIRWTHHYTKSTTVEHSTVDTGVQMYTTGQMSSTMVKLTAVQQYISRVPFSKSVQ